MYYFLDSKDLEDQIAVLKFIKHTLDPKTIYILESLIDNIEDDFLYKRENLEEIVTNIKEVKTSLNDIDYDYDEFRQKIKDKIDEIIENNPNVSAEFLSEPLYELKEMMVELEEHYDLCDNVNKLDSIVDDLNNEIDV
ncbi:MAG: hypothetical protein RSC93_00155 [Erysipelotrichaceae bacterium]